MGHFGANMLEQIPQAGCPRGQAMYRRIVSAAPTKLCLWQAPWSKLWTGKTDMKIGHLKPDFIYLKLRIKFISFSHTSVVQSVLKFCKFFVYGTNMVRKVTRILMTQIENRSYTHYDPRKTG